MNNLQHIAKDDYGHVLLTLNPLFPPKSSSRTWEYTHPLFTAKVCLPIKQKANAKVCSSTKAITMD